MQVAKSLVYGLVHGLIHDQTRRHELLEVLGLVNADQQLIGGDYVPIKKLTEAYRLLAEALDHDFIGWNYGIAFDLDAVGLLGYLLKHAASLEEALACHFKYYKLLGSGVEFYMERTSKRYTIEIGISPAFEHEFDFASQQEAEGIVAFFAKSIQVLTAKTLFPDKIELKRRQPAEYPASFEPYLRLTRFQSQRYSITIPVEYLDYPIITSSPALLKHLEQFARDKVGNLGGYFSQQVEHLLVKHFSNGFLSLEEVARHVNLSPRQLQRKLKEENESFKGILEKIKSQFSEAFIRDEALTIAQIAFAMGFSEVSSFINYFKRQFGCSPAAFRRKNAAR